MVERVFVHIGLPKTATSYLQTIIWSSRDELRARGVVVPGAERRDHLWASRTVREDHHQERAPGGTGRRGPGSATSWPGPTARDWSATSSSPLRQPEQAEAMVEALPTDEVHVVVTAREPLGLFTASWQESLKNGSTTPMADYAPA